MTTNFAVVLSGLFLLKFVAWVCAAGWLGFAGLALYGLAKRKPLLPARDSHTPTDAPTVSVLIPARNEAGRVLARSVRSVLAQDYERLEVIAVNDRSTDDTEAVLRSIAETDARLLVIDGAEPPDGWLGKTYALQQALDASRGSWVLTVDADMLLERQAVRVAVGRALACGLDVLTLVPYFEAASFWERVFTPAWMLVLLGAQPSANLDSPKAEPFVAFGGFMLIRREALSRVGDFAAVRADIIEDIRLAGLLKRLGARYRVEHAPDLIGTRMQNNFHDIWSFLTRTMFAAMRYSHALGLVYTFVGYAFVVAPPLVAALCVLKLAAGSSAAWPGALAAPTLSVWVIQVVALAFICRGARIPAAYALTTPLGLALFYTALPASMLDMLRGKGLGWKERRVYRRAGAGPPRRANPDGR